MTKDERVDWAGHFNRVAEKISDLAHELEDNKDVNEFLQEIQRHARELEKNINAVKELVTGS
ncbi:MAG TPA: hypothetical protein VLG50_08560 [Candidatus Saccharimonadales bacterium]|nr:hypothetical protein [Candidatus Saccharimonadales bacterium]